MVIKSFVLSIFELILTAHFVRNHLFHMDLKFIPIAIQKSLFYNSVIP